MNEILTKISSYNIFNYLFPGAVFVVVGERLALLALPNVDLVTRLLIYYSVGLTISRVGSVVLEPVLKKIGFVSYSDYGEYVRACSKDPKVETLVESTNTYRTIAAGVLCLIVAWVAKQLGSQLDLSPTIVTGAALTLLLLLFLVSFRKQSAYVGKRVTAHISCPAPAVPTPAASPLPPPPPATVGSHP